MAALGSIEKQKKLPFIFNLSGFLPHAITNFLFYLLPPAVLTVFSIKAQPHPYFPYLAVLTVLFGFSMVLFKHQETPGDRRLIHWLLPLLLGGFLWISYDFVESDLFDRLNLANADFRKARLDRFDLRHVDLKNARLDSSSLRDTRLNSALMSGASLVGAEADAADMSAAVLEQANLTGATMAGANLSSAILTGVRMESAQLDGANLRNAVLEDADLRNASFRHTRLDAAELNGANLSGIDLSFADLSYARLWKAILDSATMEKTNLTRAALRNATLRGADLSRSTLLHADLSYADLRGTNLANADLRNAELRGADLRRAHLAGADLRHAELSQARLEGAMMNAAQLDSADLSQAQLDSVILVDATLRGTDLTEADLTDANMVGADLRRAKLAGANLHRANLDSADLDRANLDGAILSHASMRGTTIDHADLAGTKDFQPPNRQVEIRGEEAYDPAEQQQAFATADFVAPNIQITVNPYDEEATAELGWLIRQAMIAADYNEEKFLPLVPWRSVQKKSKRASEVDIEIYVTDNREAAELIEDLLLQLLPSANVDPRRVLGETDRPIEIRILNRPRTLVEYSTHDRDESRLEEKLRKLGFDTKALRQGPIFTPANAIWHGSLVPREELYNVAKAARTGGLPIKKVMLLDAPDTSPLKIAARPRNLWVKGPGFSDGYWGG